ncbi:MAG: Phage integrase family protein [Deltaproteobacteria bacterium ADurb.Bin072]|nr:MAG: Phage integrase family protein [Deltaproteobacteria bacterium ADurb.Bin072]
MKGSIHCRSDLKHPWYYIKWYWDGQYHTIAYYNGRRMYNRKGPDGAEKLLHQMQGDSERGTFSLEKYLRGQSQVKPFLYEWLEECKDNWSPGTYKGYYSLIKNHLDPFFSKYLYALPEVQLNVINKLKNELKLTPKGKKNVIDCLHSALDYACRSRLIDFMPKFPKRGDYQIEDPDPKYVSKDVQSEIIEAIPAKHRPIFYFLAYHMRRPSEAMRLMKEDYDPVKKCFKVRRGISANQEVEYTKTKKKHEIPCSKSFLPILESMVTEFPFSPYIFTTQESHHPHKRYTRAILDRLWKEACKKVGVQISLYEGTKHSTAQGYLDAGYSYEQLQIITDHASKESVKRYAHAQLENKRALLDGDVVPLKIARNKKIRE